jgi:hypothetical protein
MPLDVTKRLVGWRRSIRRIGGFWLGTANYGLETGNEGDMVDWYLNRLGQRLVENSGGYVTWEGFLAKAELTYEGETYIRSLFDLANKLKCKYTRIGANLLTNGDVETDPAVTGLTWQSYGGVPPVSLDWSTAWAVRGTHSMYCKTDTYDHGGEQGGTLVEHDITIEEETPYQMFVTVNNLDAAGRWIVKLYQDTGGGAAGAMIARGKTPGGKTGVFVVQVDIPDTNTHTNVMMTIEGKMPGHGVNDQAEGYFDNAILQLAPQASETEWYSDADSIAAYGQHDDILLEAQMTSTAAAAKAQRKLAERAWPRSLPPPSIGGGSLGGGDGLKLTFAGYVFTLGWKYTLENGQTDASTHVANIVAESDYITAGAITTNALQYLMPATYQMMAWDAIEEIILSSDANNAEYEGGVYADRLFHYGPLSTDVKYYYEGGRLRDANMAPALPWGARPGIVHLSDMPAGPVSATGNIEDDPRNVRYDEVEFIAPDGVRFSQTQEY